MSGIKKVSVGTGATKLLDSSSTRNWFVVDNPSDTDILIAFTRDSSEITGSGGAKPGIVLKSGEFRGFGLSSDDFLARQSCRHEVWALHEGLGSKDVTVHAG